MSGKLAPPPSKKPVARPPKPLSKEQINRMLEQNHDFEELKQWCEIFDMKIANFYRYGEKININGNIDKNRKRYTKKTKLEIREHYLLTQNYAATAKEFGVNESTVRTIVKTPTRNGKLNDKRNHSGAGGPLTYPLEVEKDILSWLLELRDLHVPVSILTLQEKAKRVVRPHNPTFNASRGWVEKFFARHQLSLLSRTSVSQKLAKQLEGSITKFNEYTGRYIRTGKYPYSLGANMNETPAFFDMIPAKSICKTGSRECIVRTSGSEKKTCYCCTFCYRRWNHATTNVNIQRKDG